ncbi:hypothetical protein [Hydrogenophaga palleronii]|uniref:hypothetical protein n=1 Tax=Hydrogenophaga palleronii TaxID=65655 RepID=UPI0008264F2B|nr:hypothetical protein [Hydrogenophaga palleronii]
MPKQRVLVHVVGFSDVERHALNTVFRLSQERELSYKPWMPMTATGAVAPVAAQVVLVDGESLEAVLSHAKGMPAGQRLIWVGADAPEHAWRVLQRPIEWAAVLHDLDLVFAARQVDSGHLDLDVTLPGPLDFDLEMDVDEPVHTVRRALVVGADEQEGTYLRTRLALAKVGLVDEAVDVQSALDLMQRYRYVCGVFNLDDHRMDVWAMMSLFVQRNPQALTLASTELAGPLAGWWRRRRVRRDAHRVGITALVERPFQPRQISSWLDLI